MGPQHQDPQDDQGQGAKNVVTGVFKEKKASHLLLSHGVMEHQITLYIIDVNHCIAPEKDQNLVPSSHSGANLVDSKPQWLSWSPWNWFCFAERPLKQSKQNEVWEMLFET